MVGCQDAQPNVLIVTLDTTRHDRVGCYGDPEAQTPTLDALAERGLLFERTYSSVALTLPAHTTIMSGVEPFVHGVHNNGRFIVPDRLETLAERLGARGYRTGGFVSAFVLDSSYNLDQGFDIYSDDVTSDSDALSMTVPQRPGAEVVDDLIEWLDEANEEKTPFFAWAHLYDAHFPRNVEPPFDTIRDPYRAEIAYADAQTGRILAALSERGLSENTMIIVTADHGEAFGEHDEATHGLLAYDATLRVPLIVAGPGVPQGQREESPAYHRDLVPTLLGLLEMPIPEELTGSDLLARRRAADSGDLAYSGIDAPEAASASASASASAPASAPERIGYFEAHSPKIDLGWEKIEGVRSEQWKFTAWPPPEELYDVVKDPRELNNLAAQHPEIIDEMRWQHEELLSRAGVDAYASSEMDLDPAQAAQLAALGYIEAVAAFEEGKVPDPRRFIGVHGWVGEARDLAMAGEFDQAIAALETLRESASVRALVLRTLAPVYAQAGRHEEAIAAYRDYVEMTEAKEAHLGIAESQIALGRPQEALTTLEQADISARGGGAMLRATALGKLGRFAEAREMIDRAFTRRSPGEKEPNSLREDENPNERARLQEQERIHARVRLAVGIAGTPDLESELRGLLAARPDDPFVQSSLGFALTMLGRPDAAIEGLSLLRTAALTSPEDPEIQANLGWGAYRAGVREEAKRHLEQALELDGRRSLERARLAKVLASLGETEAARTEATRALRQDPGAAWSAEIRSIAMADARKDSDAAEGGPNPVSAR
ncbi:MAG: sulfatase-like hydrolase/transferase [Myxococcota bacterium]